MCRHGHHVESKSHTLSSTASWNQSQDMTNQVMGKDRHDSAEHEKAQQYTSSKATTKAWKDTLEEGVTKSAAHKCAHGTKQRLESTRNIKRLTMRATLTKLLGDTVHKSTWDDSLRQSRSIDATVKKDKWSLQGDKKDCFDRTQQECTE